ncbi:MAG: glycerol-3-phosphate acyltransferase [Dehalococcoidales bacterium]|jgi:glycerol-3-phosphate acyltransferase PlsY
MDIWLKFVILVAAAYLVGAMPLSYLAGRSRGIDLRKQGTQQVGGGNLWRTTSRALGLSIGIFDFFKGMMMIIIAWRVGLDPGLQFAVGLATVAGHNWPVFLRFHGGRGIATSLGIIIILPMLNTDEITTWPLVIFFTVGVAGLVIARRTPVPILLGLISLPVTSKVVDDPPSLTFAYLALLLIIVIKRLTAQKSSEKIQTGMGRVLWNRLLFDRDIRDRSAWVHRELPPKKESGA